MEEITYKGETYVVDGQPEYANPRGEKFPIETWVAPGHNKETGEEIKIFWRFDYRKLLNQLDYLRKDTFPETWEEYLVSRPFFVHKNFPPENLPWDCGHIIDIY